MKRSGPPERRTPLARSSTLRQGGRLARTGRIAPQSAKRRSEASTRDAVRREVHERDRRCVAELLVPDVRCAGPLDVDEVIPRSAYPGGHLDPANCQLLCRAHHDWKHAHPADAAALGLRRWSWDVQPPES
jgi:5-methylcytosine-specific restriction endonuclease McrA